MFTSNASKITQSRKELKIKISFESKSIDPFCIAHLHPDDPDGIHAGRQRRTISIVQKKSNIDYTTLMVPESQLTMKTQ